MRPVSLLILVAVLASHVGCSRRQRQPIFLASPLAIVSPNDGVSRCVERLLARSRYTGYIEQTVDKEMGFFRVMARNTYAMVEHSKRGPLLPKGKYPADVKFYNVQCTGLDQALITPMNETGALDERYVMDSWQHDELLRYGGAIGVVVTPALPPPPPGR
ncbi:MAG: hypothetical protein Q8L48_26200 [Archangium sp.]|nr:hypothetical protein [Archangium sp.]